MQPDRREAMELRKFGGTSLQVSAIGLGCARIGGIFKDEPQSFVRLLSSALDGGINFFDTADMYSQGESETLLGRAFAGKRDQVIFASKAGYRLPAQRRAIARIKPLVRPLIKLLKLKRENLPSVVRGAPTQDFSGAYLRGCIEGSLRRLKTDRLDLFQLHSPPAASVAHGDWVQALSRLRDEGKIRWYGVSCDDALAARAALQIPGVSALQLPLSLIEHGIADEILPLARARNIAVIAREILANGLLAKELSQLDLKNYCATMEEQGRRREQLAKVEQLAREQGTSVQRLALQYAADRPGVSVALVGLRTQEQLARTLALLQEPRLPPAALGAASGI
jgi:aryl-alcohol dehydrogenase-like predicted oxidoreductase